MKKHLSDAVLLSLALVVLSLAEGCSDSPTQPGGGQVSMTSRYTSNPVALVKVNAPSSAKYTAAVVVDSIRVSRVRFVLSHVKFETGGDTADFRTLPFVFEPRIDGSLEVVSVANVPFGTYRSVKFKIHHIDSSDVRGLSAFELYTLGDFLADQRYSIIIDGIVYRTGQAGQSFRFRSQVDAEQEYLLTPTLVVDETAPSVNVTMTVTSSAWFRGAGNALLDPTDPSNQSQIDETLKTSIKVYGDNNRDGQPD